MVTQRMPPSGRPLATGAQPSTVVVHLLGRFGVTRAGMAVDMPPGTHRVVALLALRGRPVERRDAAGCLWMDKSEARAQANLRSALWRLRHCPVVLVADHGTELALSPDVAVDVDAVSAVARTLITESEAVDLDAVDDRALEVELLPTWYDDFVESERERLRQLRAHALEALSRRLLRAGECPRAVAVGLAAVRLSPLRESAHRAVIEAHLAEGNRGEAIAQLRRLDQVLHEQLGIAPSPDTFDLVTRDGASRRSPLVGRQRVPEPTDEELPPVRV
jgi:DNA-binding SARP family transcriptional activator